ncbi:DUF167 domain-containing protein [Micromonospora sp. WMMD708]|uniref:DUF167 domain-containing protein n=1 Tax=Micromonospora sp. WMMD708 TaxID=3403464 RepID=UPI003BF5AA17
MPTDDTVTVAVRVRPGASRPRVGGCFPGPHGPALVVAVTAPAVDGRATEAARRALADALGVRPSAVALRTGAASRDKLFLVDGATPEVTALLRRLRDGSAG